MQAIATNRLVNLWRMDQSGNGFILNILTYSITSLATPKRRALIWSLF